MKKTFDIIQDHKLIFAMAFTLLLILWFVEPPIWTCQVDRFHGSPGGGKDWDCNLTIDFFNQLRYSIVIIVWVALMIWLFRKRQNRQS